MHPLEPADHEAAAALFLRTYPLRQDEITARPEQQRFAATDDKGRLIAYAALWPFHPDGYRFDLIVAPERRRHGIGDDLLRQLGELARAAGAITLQARIDDTWAESRSFLLARQFRETMRMHRQVLRLADATAETGAEARLAATGITITTLGAETRRDPACWTRFRDLSHAASEGWPDPDPRPGPPSLDDTDVVRRRVEALPGGVEDCFLAVHDGEYVGFSGPLGTAVHPAHRGCGIATALKTRVVCAARDRGLETLTTASGNPAMLHINERLGYRRTSTEIRFVKPL